MGRGTKIAATVTGVVLVVAVLPSAVGMAGSAATVACSTAAVQAGTSTTSLPRVPLVASYSVQARPQDVTRFAVKASAAPAWVQVVGAGQVDGLSDSQVAVRHLDGTVSTYAHLDQVKVSAGQWVAAGQLLGRTQVSAGVAWTDFTVGPAGVLTDPVKWFTTQGVALDGQLPTDPVVADFDPQGLPAAVVVLSSSGEGGLAGFSLPPPGEPRKGSVSTAPSSIPAPMLGYYQAAGARFQIPWVLLAGIGMEETNHWRNQNTSSAGAQGAMQFMPSTFAAEGVDGDGDGRIDILNPADSVFTAAHYLVDSGVRAGQDGVRKALLAYNHADWYVNDVLYYTAAYAAQYGAGTSLVATGGCPTGTGLGASLPAATPEQIRIVVTFALAQVGKPYVMGGTGPNAWDCSGLTQVAYAQIGLRLPRTAAAQRDWLAAGHGTQIPLGQEQAGDLIFWDSYLGPGTVGHVMIVADPARQLTVEAHDHAHGVGQFSYAGKAATKTIFQIWRPAIGGA